MSGKMLARVADALYWMSRYVERAEHAARVLEVTRGSLIDLAEVDAPAAERLWVDTLSALGMGHKLDVAAAVFDEGEPASIVSALSRARENARQVREVISSEMWEHLNQAYWDLREAAADSQRDEPLSQTLADVVTASFLWGGVTDGTMRRGEGWLFIKLGQFVERADRVSRLVSVISRMAQERPSGDALPTGDNLPWIALLRGLSALEAYRKVQPTRIEPRRVVEFLVLDRDFPRTVRYSVAVAADFARRLSEGGHDEARAVSRAFGRLAALIDYADLDDIVDEGVDAFLQRVLSELSHASLAVQRSYFLH